MEMEREFDSDLSFTSKSVDLAHTMEHPFSSKAVAKCIRSLNEKITQLTLENTVLRDSPETGKKRKSKDQEKQRKFTINTVENELSHSEELQLTILKHQLRTEKHRNSSAHHELNHLRSALQEAHSQLRVPSSPDCTYLLEQKQRELEFAKHEIALLRQTVSQQRQENQVLLQRSRHSEGFAQDISCLNDKLLLTLQRSSPSSITKLQEELRRMNNRYSEVLRALSV